MPVPASPYVSYSVHGLPGLGKVHRKITDGEATTNDPFSRRDNAFQ